MPYSMYGRQVTPVSVTLKLGGPYRLYPPHQVGLSSAEGSKAETSSPPGTVSV